MLLLAKEGEVLGLLNAENVGDADISDGCSVIDVGAILGPAKDEVGSLVGLILPAVGENDSSKEGDVEGPSIGFVGAEDVTKLGCPVAVEGAKLNCPLGSSERPDGDIVGKSLSSEDGLSLDNRVGVCESVDESFWVGTSLDPDDGELLPNSVGFPEVVVGCSLSLNIEGDRLGSKVASPNVGALLTLVGTNDSKDGSLLGVRLTPIVGVWLIDSLGLLLIVEVGFSEFKEGEILGKLLSLGAVGVTDTNDGTKEGGELSRGRDGAEVGDKLSIEIVGATDIAVGSSLGAILLIIVGGSESPDGS